MDLGILALMIPISAIVLGAGGGIIQSILKSQERRMEMRLRAQQGQNEDVTRQLDALRAEVAALRDTSTQFDMSLEHNVERLEERVGRVETKVAAAPVAAPPSEEVQRVGLR
jgi:hypothetical protein